MSAGAYAFFFGHDGSTTAPPLGAFGTLGAAGTLSGASGLPSNRRASLAELRVAAGTDLSDLPSDPAVDLPDALVNTRTGPGLGQSEVSVAANGDAIVVAYNDVRGFFTTARDVTGWSVSADGGRTFVEGGKLPHVVGVPHFQRAGDPGLAMSTTGHVFLTDLCEAPGVANLTAICLTRGTVGGATVAWEEPRFVASASASTSLLDKPFVATDPTGTHVYVTYTRFSVTTPNGQIEMAASHDGGMTFGTPVVLAPGSSIVNQGSEPAVGPGGEVYVTWEHGYLSTLFPEIVVRKSTDHGATFHSVSVVATIRSIARTPPLGYNRPTINDFPRIDVARGGPHVGEVYVTFHDASAGDADVYVSRSSDGGASWSTPVRVNDVQVGLQFFPVVRVEPNGAVDVMWYDRRYHPTTAFTWTFWAQSTDGARTFGPNLQASDDGTNWLATPSDIIPNFGDYNGLATTLGHSYPGWGDGRFGDPDVFVSTEVAGPPAIVADRATKQRTRALQ